MSSFFTLLLLISLGSIVYYVIKRFKTKSKDPDTYNKIKKRVWYAVIIFILSFIGIGMTSTKAPALSFSKPEFTANSAGVAIIKGKSDKKVEITTDGDVAITSDKEGEFAFNYQLPKSTDKKITVKAKNKDGKVTEKEVTIKPSTKTTKKQVNRQSATDDNNITLMKEKLSKKVTFKEFLDSYYSIIPSSDQTVVFDKLLNKAKVTWSGTVVESMHSRLSVIESSKFDGSNWSDISSTGNVAYVVFVKNILNASRFKSGDKVTFTGTITSRGSNLKAYKTNWDINATSVALDK